MKKLICAALLLFTAAAVFAADPVEGYWVSINEEGELTAGWHIYQKDGVLYGRRKAPRHHRNRGKGIV